MWGKRENPLEHYLDCSPVRTRPSTGDWAANSTLNGRNDTESIGQRLGITRAAAALILLSEVPAISTLGNSILALLSVTTALVFTVYLIEPAKLRGRRTNQRLEECLISSAVEGVVARVEGSEIPEGERDRILEKFHRGRKGRSAVEGTGLGLLIAKTIAACDGGKLWLDNEPQGPAFCFGLPMGAKERDA